MRTKNKSKLKGPMLVAETVINVNYHIAAWLVLGLSS